MQMTRSGSGKPLLLVHGLGSSQIFWSSIKPALVAREVITIDLPGHGGTPAEEDSGTFSGLVRSLEAFLAQHNLVGIDVVGASLGGRLALELARRGKAGAVVALDPGGFWQGWERLYARNSLLASVSILRGIKPALPIASEYSVSRTLLLLQLSARPWALDSKIVEAELKSFASTPTFHALVEDLAAGPVQDGPAAPGSGPITIGWGRHDRLCLPVQAGRARAAFPSAELHWFEKSGHFPSLDEPEETVKLILSRTG